MTRRLAAAAAILASVGTPASAHRLDEYLQAATVSVETGRVRVQLSLTPGIAVYPDLLVVLDTDRDGQLSEVERRAYAEAVIRDLSLSVDGRPVPLRLASSAAASLPDMEDGLGAIDLELDAEVPPRGGRRALVFENHHASPIGAYLVNSLVAADPRIRIVSQERNYRQSFYRLEYVETVSRPGAAAGGRRRAPTVSGSLSE